MKNRFYKNSHLGLGLFTLLALTACGPGADKVNTPDPVTSVQSTTMENDLLQKWTGPYGGVPAFDQMKLEDLRPAIEKGMEMHLQEIEKIANNPAPATFDNTILAMEQAGEPLNRAFTYYGIWSSNMSSPEFRVIQEELAPKISEYSSKISQNEKLFQRIKAIYEASLEQPLEPQKQRTVQLIYEDFAMEGADLSPEDKKR